jgi:hypothetical protein
MKIRPLRIFLAVVQINRSFFLRARFPQIRSSFSLLFCLGQPAGAGACQMSDLYTKKYHLGAGGMKGEFFW